MYGLWDKGNHSNFYMNGPLLTLALGDICSANVDVIENSANINFLAGGGVCGAIHRAAGTALETACRPLAPCSTGQAVITPAYDLQALHVIHAVGPRYLDGTRGEKELLASTYQAIAKLMSNSGCRPIAIPSISIGTYRYPMDEAALIAIDTLQRELDFDINPPLSASTKKPWMLIELR